MISFKTQPGPAAPSCFQPLCSDELTWGDERYHSLLSYKSKVGKLRKLSTFFKRSKLLLKKKTQRRNPTILRGFNLSDLLVSNLLQIRECDTCLCSTPHWLLKGLFYQETVDGYEPSQHFKALYPQHLSESICYCCGVSPGVTGTYRTRRLTRTACIISQCILNLLFHTLYWSHFCWCDSANCVLKGGFLFFSQTHTHTHRTKTETRTRHSPPPRRCCWGLFRSRRWRWLETWSRTCACCETWWPTWWHPCRFR